MVPPPASDLDTSASPPPYSLTSDPIPEGNISTESEAYVGPNTIFSHRLWDRRMWAKIIDLKAKNGELERQYSTLEIEHKMLQGDNKRLEKEDRNSREYIGHLWTRLHHSEISALRLSLESSELRAGDLAMFLYRAAVLFATGIAAGLALGVALGVQSK